MYVFKKAGDSFILDHKTEIENELPSGVYKIELIPQVGIAFKSLDIQKDNLVVVKDGHSANVLKTIKTFTSEDTKARYKKCGVTHKMGLLFEGPPGTGKSATINPVIDQLVREGALVFFDADPSLVATVLPAVRQQNPEKLIAIVYEEFDEWLKQDQATINSFLDGQLSVNNMVVLATTNYISRIPARIKNRPSRFQYVINIGVPSKEFREEWFRAKLTEIGEVDKLAMFVDQSDGMVIDQMKDLIVSHIALDMPLPDVVKKLQDMSEGAVGYDDAVEDSYFNQLRSEELRKIFSLPKGLSLKK